MTLIIAKYRFYITIGQVLIQLNSYRKIAEDIAMYAVFILNIATSLANDL